MFTSKILAIFALAIGLFTPDQRGLFWIAAAIFWVASEIA